MKRRTQLSTAITACAALAAFGLAGPAAASGHQPVKKGTIVTSRVTTLGRVLSNTKGRVMYLYSKDTHDTSHCHGGCVQAWPRVMSPVKPRAGARVNLHHLARTAGGQATYYGHPLYYFVGDPGKGHTGEAEEGFYLVSTAGKAVHKKKPTGQTGPTGPTPYVPPAATTAAEVTTGTAGGGTVLKNAADSKTLYYLTGDEHAGGTFSCTDTCQQTWIPLMTDGAPTVGGSASAANLSTVTRADDDSEVQVTYNGYPVYEFTGDSSTSSASGNLLASYGGYWYDISFV